MIFLVVLGFSGQFCCWKVIWDSLGILGDLGQAAPQTAAERFSITSKVQAQNGDCWLGLKLGSDTRSNFEDIFLICRKVRTR